MNVLVTGGAGYIGSETVRYFMEMGLEPIVLDNLSTGSADSTPGAILYEGDIANEALVSSILSEHQIETVVHFAASKNVGESMTNPEKYWRNNVMGTSALLDQMAANGVKKIVFSSSCSVYGNPTRLPVTEDERLDPQSVYAESKLICERMLHWHSLARGLKAVSLRYFNAAGASLDGRFGEDWNRSENLIPKALRALLTEEVTLEIYGTDYETLDGTAIRDYVHVRDLAVAHYKALYFLATHDGHTPVNIGSGKGSSVMEIITAAEQLSKLQLSSRTTARRPGDPEAVYANYSLAEEVLDWRPSIGLEGIVSSALAWHRRQVAH